MLTLVCRAAMYYVVAAVIVIIVLLWIFRPVSNDIESFVSGCWIAPDDFCDAADIDSMMIVIDDLTDTGMFAAGKRNGHIVIMPNAFNSAFTIEYNSASNPASSKQIIKGAVKFEDESHQNIWGETCEIEVDMVHGSMEIRSIDVDPISDKRKIYARFYRHNELSDMGMNIKNEPQE